MKKEEKKVQIYNSKTKQKEEETRYVYTPDKGKCFQYKNTKHKLIDYKNKKGIEIHTRNEKINDIYEEVDLPNNIDELSERVLKRLERDANYGRKGAIS